MIKFGTGGWREIIGDKFTKKNVQLICQAMCELVDDTGIVIGFDRRFLSHISAGWAAEVFAANNKKVYFINKNAPTPLIMYTVSERNISYGMSITASHNPAAYNGIKIFTAGGRDADRQVTDKIEEIIKGITEVKTMDFNDGIAKGIVEIIHPQNQYVDSILNQINADKIRQANLQIVVDPMFGVSRSALLAVLVTSRCDVMVINDNNDALFGGRLPAPEESTLHALRDKVVENRFDLGIATDGDGDRIGIIDNDGKFIHPNMLLAILYHYLLNYKGEKGAVVRNIATTHLLDKIAAAHNEACYEVPVGFKSISSKIDEVDALIGGESSGGLTIRGHIKGKDGIFAAALIVEMVAITGKSVSEFVKEIEDTYGKAYWVEQSYTFSAELKEQLIKTLFEDKKLPDFGKAIEKTSLKDGVKVYFENGDWVIARFSGTEPLIRVFSEARHKSDAMYYAEKFKEFLQLD